MRVPDRGRERVQEVGEFATTVHGLLAPRDWLKAHRVTPVAMEATGVYWKPVCEILEDFQASPLPHSATPVVCAIDAMPPPGFKPEPTRGF